LRCSCRIVPRPCSTIHGCIIRRADTSLWRPAMSLDRRQFLLSAAALAASARSAFPDEAATGALPLSVRADFPIASAQTYLNSAAIHPMSVHAARALQQHIEFRTKG